MNTPRPNTIHRRQFLQGSATLPVFGLPVATTLAAEVDAQGSRVDATRKVVVERPREVPVTHEADVIAVGGTQGGLGGCFAAIAAGRAGAKTIFVEEHGHIELHTPLGLGVVVGVQTWWPTMNEGLFRELAVAVVKTGQHAKAPTTLEALLEKGELISRYHEAVTTALLQMMQDAGVEMLFHTKFVDAVIEAGTLKAIIVESPQGRHALSAKVFVDSTGLGEIAAASGAPMVREEAYMGLQSFIAGVDEQKYQTWLKAENQPLDESYRVWVESLVGPFAELENPWNQWWPELLGDRFATAYVRQAKVAQENGDLTMLHRWKEKGIMAIAEGVKTDTGIARPRTYITGIDPLKAADISWAEVTSRLMLAEYQRFLKKYIPGFELCVIERVADSIGLRGGRHLDVPGLPQENFQRDLKSSDAIFLMKKGKDGKIVEIPFATLLPERVEGLLVVGKSSAGGRTLSTAHVVLFQGQAAGTAAAMAAKQGITPRQVEIKKLQGALKEAGVLVPY